MVTFAAAEYTWGISGPTFLLIFFGLSGVIVAGTLWHRSRLFAGPDQPIAADLGPDQAAYLAGGATRALHASLAALRTAGAVDVSSRTLVATGGLPPGASDLDRAIHQAASNGRLTVSALAADPWVGPALVRLRDGLEQSGLAVSAEARRAARTGPLLLLLVGAVGGLRISASNGWPIGFLVVGLIALAAVAGLLLVRIPRTTAAGNRAVNRLQRQYRHLRPVLHPAWQTYGPAGTAMGVALFGAAALWSAHPVLATAAGIKASAVGATAAGGGGYGYHSGCGGGDGGGGDGGGGGCGGGCGG